MNNNEKKECATSGLGAPHPIRKLYPRQAGQAPPLQLSGVYAYTFKKAKKKNKRRNYVNGFAVPTTEWQKTTNATKARQRACPLLHCAAPWMGEKHCAVGLSACT